MYCHYGKSIPRTAEEQFLHFRYFRRESRRAAWGGDVVFFHVSSDPNSYVYQVVIYEGDNHLVSATDPAQGIIWQTIAMRAGRVLRLCGFPAGSVPFVSRSHASTPGI